MSLPKEWLIPMARALVNSGCSGPVYVLGDQVTWFTYDYARRQLYRKGLLRNPSEPFVPDHQNPRMVSFRTLLGMLGFHEFYDIDLNGHADLNWDLSRALPSDSRKQAGLVIDIGTCEHIFNLPQVFTNIVELLKPGGIVFHLAPLSWYNHGFVNFNPLFFKEFYEQNNFEVLEHILIVSPFLYSFQCLLSRFGLEERYLLSELPPLYFVLNDESERLRRIADHIGMGGRVIFQFVARKALNDVPVTFPHQRTYRQTILGC